MSRRSAGILLHLTSLPGPFGIGDFGPQADRFLRWAARAGQRIWQVLPLHPTGTFNSPYGGVSAFAGNPLLISPERLAGEGLLPAGALDRASSFRRSRVDYAAVRAWKDALLRASWSHFQRHAGSARRRDLESFVGGSSTGWLADWTIFTALQSRFPSMSWIDWPEGLARRDPAALAAARSDLAREIEYQQYVQFLFFRHWSAVRALARSLAIDVLADLPIYVAHDSADVWAHRELFALDEGGRPELVAGVPPDAFSETGQLWGYPVYRWDRMEQDGFAWWIDRLRAEFSQADVVRIDHFRGFASYWAVGPSEPDARAGTWLPGPGEKFFRVIREKIPGADIVAEDLGTVTPDVDALLSSSGIPGMRVLQFAFAEDDSPHLPRHHIANSVVYTGTHDNDTTRGWFAGLSRADRERVVSELGGGGTEIEWDLIRAAYGSVADRAIVPLQDVFGLGSDARMNKPATAEGNWEWRARETDFTPERAERLRRLARDSGRFGD